MSLFHLRMWPAFVLLALLLPQVYADTPAESGVGPEEALRREFDAALQGMNAARQAGPRDIPFLDQAILRLPEGFDFVPNPAAGRFMAAVGNRVDEGFIGLILPEDETDWIASVAFEKSGYIKDEDAKNWNVDDMLRSLKEGVEEMNRARASRGIPELEVLGWAEAPDYDADGHRLVWSLIVNNKGAPADQPQSVNYNTHALGREGYISLNLVTARDNVEKRKPIAHTLLASLEFNPGKRYEDFNAETDHMAEFGLAALVGGAIAAKKLGLFALAGVFLAKFGKMMVIAAAALFGVFGKRRRKQDQSGGTLDA